MRRLEVEAELVTRPSFRPVWLLSKVGPYSIGLINSEWQLVSRLALLQCTGLPLALNCAAVGWNHISSRGKATVIFSLMLHDGLFWPLMFTTRAPQNWLMNQHAARTTLNLILVIYKLSCLCVCDSFLPGWWKHFWFGLFAQIFPLSHKTIRPLALLCNFPVSSCPWTHQSAMSHKFSNCKSGL